MATPDDVLDFWFGPPAETADDLLRKVGRWFAGGADGDDAIRRRFADDVERALAGGLDAWAGTPRGLLALVLVLDQFPRSLYRDTTRAFAGDARALALARRAFADGWDRELAWEQRQFIIMPFLHQEDLAAQERGVELMTAALAAAPALNQPAFAAGLEQARKYCDVVQRFGRLPHRNAVLGRASTAAELEFLRAWDAGAQPAIMREVAAVAQRDRQRDV